MPAAAADTAMALLKPPQRRMLRTLADALAQGDRVQLDQVVCTLPSLETDHLAVLRAGLEILFDMAGSEMDVDKETFIEAMARGQLPPGTRVPSRQAADSSHAEDRAADLGGEPAPAKAKPERRGSTDVNRVVIVGGELVPESGEEEPHGRRKSRQALKQQVEEKEMRECSFAPKLTKYPAYLRGNAQTKTPCWKESKQPLQHQGVPVPPAEASTASRRTKRVEAMLEQKFQQEQKELTFKPKINPAPSRQDARPSVRASKASAELRAARKSSFKWHESLRGQVSGDTTEAPRSFFSPPARGLDEASDRSSEAEVGRPTFRRAEGFDHQVVLRG
jgi:hypothetical protein